jgi:hypothetical protein
VSGTILHTEAFNVHRKALREQRERFSASTFRALPSASR